MSIRDDIQNVTNAGEAEEMLDRVSDYLADDHDDNEEVRQEAASLMALILAEQAVKG